MKKTIEIVASYSGTINTGNYSNISPFYSAKMIIEDAEGVDIPAHQCALQNMCRQQWLNDKWDIELNRDTGVEITSREKVYETYGDYWLEKKMFVLSFISQFSSLEDLNEFRPKIEKVVESFKKKGMEGSVKDVKEAFNKQLKKLGGKDEAKK